MIEPVSYSVSMSLAASSNFFSSISICFFLQISNSSVHCWNEVSVVIHVYLYYCDPVCILVSFRCIFSLSVHVVLSSHWLFRTTAHSTRRQPFVVVVVAVVVVVVIVRHISPASGMCRSFEKMRNYPPPWQRR